MDVLQVVFMAMSSEWSRKNCYKSPFWMKFVKFVKLQTRFMDILLKFVLAD